MLWRQLLLWRARDVALTMRALIALCAWLLAAGVALAQQTIPALSPVGSQNTSVVTYQAGANWVPSAYAITGFCSTCSNGSGGTTATKSWQFQALVGTTWQTLDTQTNVSFTSNQKLTFPLTGAPAGSQWRLVITSNNDPLINVVELDVIGSPSVAVPPPRPPVTFSYGWTSPGSLPTNDAIQGSCGSLACWTFQVATWAQMQSSLLAGGSYDLWVGDSITALCDVNQASPFGVNMAIPGNTVNGLINELAQINSGFGGQTAGTSLPVVHALIINIGVNDIGTLGSDAATIEGKLQALFNSWSGPLIWTGIWPTPSNTGWKTEIDQVNAWASSFLATRAHTHDVTAQMNAALSSGGFMIPSYELVVGGTAGIHYNGSGCTAAMAVTAASLQQPF